MEPQDAAIYLRFSSERLHEPAGNQARGAATAGVKDDCTRTCFIHAIRAMTMIYRG